MPFYLRWVCLYDFVEVKINDSSSDLISCIQWNHYTEAVLFEFIQRRFHRLYFLHMKKLIKFTMLETFWISIQSIRTQPLSWGRILTFNRICPIIVSINLSLVEIAKYMIINNLFISFSQKIFNPRDTDTWKTQQTCFIREALEISSVVWHISDFILWI